jgi:hypothetical protein
LRLLFAGFGLSDFFAEGPPSSSALARRFIIRTGDDSTVRALVSTLARNAWFSV